MHFKISKLDPLLSFFGIFCGLRTAHFSFTSFSKYIFFRLCRFRELRLALILAQDGTKRIKNDTKQPGVRIICSAWKRLRARSDSFFLYGRPGHTRMYVYYMPLLYSRINTRFRPFLSLFLLPSLLALAKGRQTQLKPSYDIV